jgi:preprotein translocase subunit YajC
VSAGSANYLRRANAGLAFSSRLGRILPIILFVIIMVLLFWSTVIRPQARAARAHDELVKNLKVGDKVVTAGGVYGRVVALDEKTMTLEVAKDTRVVFDRRAARRPQD